MSKIDDIKANFDKLHKGNKSYHQIEKDQFIMKVDDSLFCCNSADSKDCYLSGKLEVADPAFIDKAAEVLKKEAEDVQGYLNGKRKGNADHIPGDTPDNEFDKPDGSADHIPD